MQETIHIRGAGVNGQKSSDAPSYGRRFIATGKILMGLFVMAYNATFAHVMQPYAQKITLSTALTTSNTIAGKVVINQSEFTVSALYATSHAATIGSIKTQIEALTGATDAIESVDVSGNVLTINAKAGNLVYLKDFSVSGGSAVTIAYDITRKILGISRYEYKEMDSNNELYFNGFRTPKPEGLTVSYTGTYLFQCEDTGIDPSKDQVYVRIVEETGKIVGAVKKTSDSGKAILVSNAQFIGSEANGMVEILLT